MNRQAYLTAILASFLLTGVVAGVVPAFAEEDEREDRTAEGAGERMEAGEEFEDEDSAAIGSGLSGLVLYGVIAAVVGTIGYTGYKIFVGRKKAPVPTHS